MTNQLRQSNAIIKSVMEWKKCVFSSKMQHFSNVKDNNQLGLTTQGVVRLHLWCIKVDPKVHDDSKWSALGKMLTLKNKLFLNNALDNSGHCVLREDVGYICQA